MTMAHFEALEAEVVAAVAMKVLERNSNVKFHYTKHTSVLKHIPGDKLNIGESSSASKSRMLSSSVGSVSLTRSLENPDAMSSSCWTGCLGRRGKKNLLSFPLVVLLPA